MADFGRRDFDDAASDRPRRRDSAPGAGRSGAQRGTPRGKAGQGGRSGGYGRQDDNRSGGRDFGDRRGDNRNDRGGRDFGDRRGGGTGRGNWNRDDDRRGGNRDGDRPNWKRDDDRRGGSRGGDRPGWNRDDNRGGGNRAGGDRPNWKRDDDRRGGSRGGDRPGWNRDDNRGGGNRAGGDRPNWKRDDDRRGGSRGGDRPGWNRDDNRGGGNRAGGDRPSWKRDDDRRGGDRPGWKRDDNRGERSADNRRGDRPYGDRPYGDRRSSSYDNRGGARGDRPYGDRRTGSYDNRGGERASGERRGGSFDKRGSSDARRGERSSDDRRTGSADNRRGERGDRRAGSFDDRRGERSFDKRSGGSFGSGRDRSADKRGGSFDNRGRGGGDRSADRRGDRPYDRGGRPGSGERDRSSGNRGGRPADDRRGGYGKRDDDRRGGRSFDDRRGARNDTRSGGRNFGDRERGTVDRPGGKFADRPARSGRDDERFDRAVPAPEDRTEQPVADEAAGESTAERQQGASPRDGVTTPDISDATGTEPDATAAGAPGEPDDESGPLGVAAAGGTTEPGGEPDDDDFALVDRAAQPVTREEQVEIADAEFRRAPREERRTDDRRGKRGRDLDDAALARELLEAPELPEDIEFSDLDAEVRRELRTLPKSLAETVGKHLVAAGNLIDTDPEAALAHAKFAKTRASRVPIVREALGLVAYHAGRWQEALAELRAVRRMTRTDQHVAVIADAERALGRPERALDLAKEMQGHQLPRDVEIELKIVAAGARRDLGQVDAAVVSLQGDDLDPRKRDPWSARLFYAYADNLLAADRRDEAIRWFLHAADADEDEETDAAERAAELADG
ncbi:hypothetical protein [Amycolatopsis granulosa]|uniref:hypothetical protein n=1 Tax=Amycolatopsis granulosa TaxID=185684 RepID=UPI001FBB0A95|nr:hypothetical protein [Amycolatopsis granulosa]NIH84116.1 tetratricopeptide (TPR) repeat protein [Amycolatopsis granulosa]